MATKDLYNEREGTKGKHKDQPPSAANLSQPGRPGEQIQGKRVRMHRDKGGERGELSAAREEGRTRDMTDYSGGHRSRPMPRRRRQNGGYEAPTEG
uniref:Uncharacterized protein n=1 Tax=Knipowitschia caucasica TaxID=637954 RepID=A0AAV2LP27_KNICA